MRRSVRRKTRFKVPRLRFTVIDILDSRLDVFSSRDRVIQVTPRTRRRKARNTDIIAINLIKWKPPMLSHHPPYLESLNPHPMESIPMMIEGEHAETRNTRIYESLKHKLVKNYIE